MHSAIVTESSYFRSKGARMALSRWIAMGWKHTEKY